MKLLPLGLLLLLLSSTIAAALNCNSLKGESLETCNEILQSNLTAEEKNESILALMNNDMFLPNFTAVEDWNKKLGFGPAPQGVPLKSSSYIKDAWLKVMAVMPSVVENGRLLAPSEGSVLTGYGYRLEAPSSTAGGDCKTDYSASSSTFLDVYANSDLIGHGNLSAFRIDSDTSFSSNLQVDATITANHYQNVRYCCDTSNGYCTRYCTECRFKSSETLTDTLQLQDTLNATFYQPKAAYSLQLINRYYNTTAGRLNFSNTTAVKLSFENSSYEKHTYTYRLTSAYPPYDVLSYEALPFESSKSSNINIQEQNRSARFIVANANSCQLEISTHFNRSLASCNLNYTPLTPTLATDKLAYFEGETIQVTVIPSDKPVQVSYGNSTVTAYGTASFTAAYPVNKVTASFNEVTVDKVIAVQQRGKLSFLFGMSLFSGLNYTLYAVLRKYWSM